MLGRFLPAIPGKMDNLKMCKPIKPFKIMAMNCTQGGAAVVDIIDQKKHYNDNDKDMSGYANIEKVYGSRSRNTLHGNF